MNPVQKTAGAALAAVAATLFFTSGASILATVPTSAVAVKCLGVNACKGQSLCATANSSSKARTAVKVKAGSR